MRADDQDKSAAPPLDVQKGPSTKNFLGAEFLTWLYFHLEEENYEVATEAILPGRGDLGETLHFRIGRKLNLAETDPEGLRVTLAGPQLDESGEILQAIRGGAFVASLGLEVSFLDRVILATLKAEDGSIREVKITDVAPPEEDEMAEESARARQRLGAEEALFLRMAALDELEDVVDGLFRRFLTRRLARAFLTEDLGRIRRSIKDGLKARAS
jgi:hypothetical protein